MLDQKVENSLKMDLVTLTDDFFIHKQIEHRNGLTFARIKKRRRQ